MAACEISALVVSHPLHVYYATTKLPVLDRMTSFHQSLAVIPADPRLPVCYVGSAFEYYYNVADSDLAPGIEIHLVTPSAKDPLQAAGSAMMRVLDKAPLEAREAARRARTESARFHASMSNALTAVLARLGIYGGTVGIDSIETQGWLSQAAPGLPTRVADDLLRHIRLVKTAPELELMRGAAEANSRALIAAVQSVRQCPTLRGLRERYFAEVANRGNTPVFMLIDGVMDETYDEPLLEGRAFLVDGVSHRAFYQGDYARTACIGAPTPELRRVTMALELAWHRIRGELHPGLLFSQIREIGRSSLKAAGYDYTVAFKPHAVGLTHEDQPRMTLEGGPLDLALVEGMVLSVDCPLLDVGVGGSAHLEDLMLITTDGAAVLHTTDPALITI